MRFPHDDPEFNDLLLIAADARRMSVAMIEKDYWVTHALWSLEAQGFEIWFKGGTSLSKGFGLIERFSEDLDLKVESGTVTGLPVVTTWKSDKKGPTAERRAFFQTFAEVLDVPGARAALHHLDGKCCNAYVRLFYPGNHIDSLDPILSPFVLLELGDARVRPAIERSMTSFVHNVLEERRMLGMYKTDNRPQRVRCLHPLVTLLEKLDILRHRVHAARFAPAQFVRHFEDAARVIARVHELPRLSEYADIGALASEMVSVRQLRALPDPTDPAFTPSEGARWEAIRDAHRAIAPMFWGQRISLDDACTAIREWLEENLPAARPPT